MPWTSSCLYTWVSVGLSASLSAIMKALNYQVRGPNSQRNNISLLFLILLSVYQRENSMWKKIDVCLPLSPQYLAKFWDILIVCIQ